MTTWHWVRHGPTHQNTFVGWRDVPADLSDAPQLARLSAHLPQEALLVSSDLRRSVATADAIAGAGRRRLAHDAGLREVHFGLWDGMRFAEIKARDPVLSRAYWERPGAHRPPGGESWAEAGARVSAAVERISAAHPGGHVIAVAHFGAILTQVQRTMGGDARAAMAHKIDNLSVTEIAYENGGWHLRGINHLP